MKNLILSVLILSVIALFAGCGDGPSGGMKSEQYDIVKKNVKQYLGEDYSASNFSVLKEGYENSEKTEFKVNYTFDLNKPFLLWEKKIPSELTFSKEKEGWKCTNNTANVSGLFGGK